ncbi:Intradiol ring-cleavage dioxygenase, core [Teratosphaeria destructans]|uniref:Intradiol ring-cleavage dioxygenase, core n=1 Tax=Teratosphaeria destructans TaxID=418781 RepID=A0A9W7SN05_9PEZI|nr:Intradiol ring-cleavage dioxygenase, core [Teratosphaeria destructans]
MVKLHALLSALCASSLVAAHPGEHHDHEEIAKQIKARDFRAAHTKRSINKCEGSAKYQETKKRSIARRSEAVQGLRAARGITAKPKKYRRDLATLEEYETVNHNMTGIDMFNSETAESTVFAANTSCILTPEVTDGPYYVVGETIRKNVKEALYSEGVDVYLEVQYLDVDTCEPVSDIAVDIWNANATGVYSGISESGNYAAGSWNSTYLRGIQFTDSDGVVSFESIFPGHYDGRATHTHLLAHMNATVLANGTLANGTGAVTHIGQLFYPEALRSAVEAVHPYNTNTQTIVSNDDDMWSIVQAGTTYDPFPEFVYVGDDISDGLFAWIQIGVNTTADYTDNSYYSVAGYITADGGYQNDASTLGSSPPGNSTS